MLPLHKITYASDNLRMLGACTQFTHRWLSFWTPDADQPNYSAATKHTRPQKSKPRRHNHTVIYEPCNNLITSAIDALSLAQLLLRSHGHAALAELRRLLLLLLLLLVVRGRHMVLRQLHCGIAFPTHRDYHSTCQNLPRTGKMLVDTLASHVAVERGAARFQSVWQK